MAQDIVNANQNLSYTNLDFSSIYTEVLDMVKQLTKNWDPSLSDESDPGVVLVKLAALIADKCNYNIDKSILEAFPLSVTQDSNARQLYEQLGYYMSWYRAATVPVTLSWKTTTLDEDGTVLSYTIPKFTTITDENETVVYSLVGTPGEEEVVVSDGLLYTDSSKNLNMIAYEGIPVQYTFNDRTVITPNMVDTQNRLYLSTAYVFENGIFIKNTEQDNYAEWRRVDNLYEFSYNVYRYKFGYDSAANLCYLEFPDNYAELFGSGIEITYLTFSTDESYADVPAQFLSKFLAAVIVGDNNDVTLTAENTKISNTEPATGHADKEGIDEAYTNYKKVVGTFKTLITLRDYLNYIRSKDVDICSNAFVCDRTNDIQSSYNIINKYQDIESIVTEVEKSTDDIQFVKTKDEDVNNNKTYYEYKNIAGSGQPTQMAFVEVLSPSISEIENYYEEIGEDVLSPFSLKFYLLQKPIALTSRGAYDNTFEMMSSDDVDINTLLADTSHLVHDFVDIEPFDPGIFKLTTDTSVPVDDNGNPAKIYYNFNTKMQQYIPLPVTNMEFQTYNPHNMGLYEGIVYYVQTQDIQWINGTTYYYKNAAGTFDEFDSEHQAEYVDTPPVNVVYTFTYQGLSYWSYIYVMVSEKRLTSDTHIDTNKTYYYKQPNSNIWLEANSLLPSPIAASINPGALGLYELAEEPLLPHVVMFKNKYPISMNISTYNSVSDEVRKDILSNVIYAFYTELDSSNIEFGDAISLDYLTQIVKDADARIKSVAFDALTYTTSAVYYDGNQQSFIEVELPKSVEEENKTDILISPSYNTLLAYLFGKDVICKSILAGTTQLLIPDNVFAYHLNQHFITQIPDIKYITGEAVINMSMQDPYYIVSETSNTKVRKSYTLQENETITLFKPLITDVETYTTGVHYDYCTYSDIELNQSYQLKQNEYFIFYISNLDSDGLLQSFSVYVYGQDAIIHPSFNVQARPSLSQYGYQVAIALINQNTSDISADTKVYSYTESRETFVSQINNDSSINNTKIGTNQTISAQAINTFTIDPSDGYRLIWSLNEPHYNGTLKQYELLPSYNPEDDIDLENIVKYNTYTLKSGEYLYYTDSTLSNLGILGAGTTIYRNCGIESELQPITNIDPYIFVNWNELSQSSSYINASGFSVIAEVNGNSTQINPYANGFYELTNDKFVRTYDTSAVAAKDYYILLMKDVSGWYVKSPDNSDYAVAKAPTTSIFSLVDVKSQYANYDISPNVLGLYEKISYQGIPLVDTYYMPTKSCENTADYLENHKTVNYPNSVNRFASVPDDDNTLLTSNFITNVSGNIVDTLHPTGDINRTADIESDYNAYINNWVLKYDTYSNDDPRPVYNIEKSSPNITVTLVGNDIKTFATHTLVSNNPGNYTFKATTNSNGELPLSNQPDWTINGYSCIPTQMGVVISGSNLEANTEYSVTITLSAIPVKTAGINDDLFNQITDITYASQITQYQYYRYGTSSSLWKCNFGLGNTAYRQVPQNGGFDGDHALYAGDSGDEGLYAIYYAYKNSDYSGQPLVDAVNTTWKNKYAIDDLVSNWTLYQFSTSNTVSWANIQNNTYADSYIEISLEALYNFSTNFSSSELLELKDNLLLGYTGARVHLYLKIIPLVKSKTNEYFGLPSTGIILYTHSNVPDMPILRPEDGDTEQYELYVIKMEDALSFIKQLQHIYGNYGDGSYSTGLYFMPLWYDMLPWFAYKDKDYYQLNDYASVTYAQVDPLVCGAIDSLALSSNPLSVMRTLFQGVQANTSLTFNQNELYTISQGDSITFETASAANSAGIFPVFTNDEVILDLDEYSVSYKRIGDDIVTLNKIQVEGCDWRGYSNLQLNTNFDNGQKLYLNQSLTLYDSDINIIETIHGNDLGNSGNIHFQLQYPMTNMSGTFIKVTSSSLTQDTILNSIYVYNILQDGKDYAYSADNYKTYVYAKRASADGAYTFNPSGIAIENLKLAAGDYIIPVNGINDIRIELSVPTINHLQFEESLGNNLTATDVTINNSLPDYPYIQPDMYVSMGPTSGTFELWNVYYCEQKTGNYLYGGNYPLYSFGIYIDTDTLNAYSAAVGGYNEMGILFQVKDSEPIHSYTDPSKTYFLGDKLHFAYMNVPDTESNYPGILNVKILNPDGTPLQPDADAQITVVLNDIFKFKNNPLLENCFDDIKTKLIELDVNQKYDYTHIPNADDIIPDPLISKEFWNKNHVYNQFTIAQLNADDIDYKFIT